jgi:hypothetical protein
MFFFNDYSFFPVSCAFLIIASLFFIVVRSFFRLSCVFSLDADTLFHFSFSLFFVPFGK